MQEIKSWVGFYSSILGYFLQAFRGTTRKFILSLILKWYLQMFACDISIFVHARNESSSSYVKLELSVKNVFLEDE